MTTKYPIILVHGIALKDLEFFRAFGGIEKVLRGEGYIVYTSTQDGFGTIENNAVQLKKQVQKIMEKHGVEKVNLIAHSKGGLDSLHMIKELEMEDHVASLTTLSTPYRGSPIATNLLKMPKFMIKFCAFWINLTYRIFRDKKPDAHKACIQLRENENIEDIASTISNKVYVQSYSSTMKESKDDFVMGIPHMAFKNYRETDTDGLVSKDSSSIGEYKGDMFKSSMSHSEIVDLTFDMKKKQKVYAFYIQLCEDLVERGF